MYGEYHIGEDYEINDWLVYQGCCVFKCKEIISDADIKLQPLYYLVVTEASILLFKALEKKKSKAVLILAAALYNLEELKKSASNEKIITLVIKLNEANTEEVLYVDECKECINLILANVKKIGMGMDKVTNVGSKVDSIIERVSELEGSLAREKTIEKLEQYASALSTVIC